MKNPEIISAVIGGAFFAIPYVGLSIGMLPSLAIGAIAFGAGELVFRTKEKKNLMENKNMYEILTDAKEKNKQILNMASKIEDVEIRQNIKEINESITKIINTIEKKPEKYDKMHNFFNYYLPITLNILNKYDEIENQSLSSADSAKFMKQTKDMLEKINMAFKGQLANLYQSDIVDTDAEMRVFESMLRADGYDTSSDFNVRKEKENEE